MMASANVARDRHYGKVTINSISVKKNPSTRYHQTPLHLRDNAYRETSQ